MTARAGDEGYVGTPEIAVIGMSGRFPGASSVTEFWRNLRDGKESLERLDDQELRALGVPQHILDDPEYVKAGAFLDGIDMFDPAFFGFSLRDASIMDPQHRLFLECASEVLEHAAYDPHRFSGAIGVFGGCGMNVYLIRNVLTNPAVLDSVGFWGARHLGNDKDFLTTRVSYCLDLKGPSVNVQTACSTSLVAIHLACQSLLQGECDIALAGGVTIEVPHRQGYVYHEGEILSPDGHCRAFDRRAMGTVLGSGVGIVALRRLDDAVASRDTVHAVIKSSAVNNDGAGKVGFLAPSVGGQTNVILEALGVAGVPPESVTYVEAHGTGTSVGDPIEVQALTDAFRAGTERTGFCGIGSVKPNVGHLDIAAGVASFIKVVESLKHRQLPPSLHFDHPNPAIDFATSPFRVVDELREWESPIYPRRAGVSSLGVGGTNAHVILEEAPPMTEDGVTRPVQLLLLSARTDTALDAATRNLSSFLCEQPDTNISDAAHTLQIGRRAFSHRRFALCKGVDDAVEALESTDAIRVASGEASEATPSVAFLFPGQGSQHVNMAAQLYETEPVFREELDRCNDVLRPHLDCDLPTKLFRSAQARQGDAASLTETALAQPAVVSVEYALARLWMSWGVKPRAMLGHSIGEFTAAVLAGVFALEEVLPLVALRGRLMQPLPRGVMVAVSLAEAEVKEFLRGIGGACIAAQNTPTRVVVSGDPEAVRTFEGRLAVDFVPHQRLETSHAFHSPMMDPIVDRFAAEVGKVVRRAPAIPFVSSVTGTWITDDEACDPGYWARHIRQPVLFGKGLETLLNKFDGGLLEVGPGKTLTTIARQHPAGRAAPLIVRSLAQPKEGRSDIESMLWALGELWLRGVEVDWEGFDWKERRRRIPLPTYPFERQRCWVEPGILPHEYGARAPQARQEGVNQVEQWFWRPFWTQSELPSTRTSRTNGEWIVFADDSGFGDRFVESLGTGATSTIVVRAGDQYERLDARHYILDPRQRADYIRLLDDLGVGGDDARRIAHLWNVGSRPEGPDSFDRHQSLGFYSLLYLTQAIANSSATQVVELLVVSSHMHRVLSGDSVDPAKATSLGPVRVIPREFPDIRCRSVDVDLGKDGSVSERQVFEHLVAELEADRSLARAVAYRGGQRYVQSFERVRPDSRSNPKLRQGGVYLITGGLGGLGLTVAQRLAERFQAKLVLVGRRAPSIDSVVKRLKRIEAVGGELLVVAADVTDSEAMEGVVRAATERFGVLNGVVHAAGVLEDGLIDLKQPEAASRVLAPKVTGTMVLDSAVEGLDLDFMVLFSSTGAALGLPGQVDYTGANAFENAFAHSKVSSKTPTIALGWGPWLEVGMAARVADESSPLSSLSPTSEVDHPFLDVCIKATSEEILYSTQYSLDDHWLVREHQIEGLGALMPGTGYLEMASASFEHTCSSGGLEIRDVLFTAPFRIGGKERQELRVSLRPVNGHYSFLFSSLKSDGQTVEHAQGELQDLSEAPKAAVSLQSIRARCTPATNGCAVNPHFRFGPRWSNLKRIELGRREALATIELPAEFQDDLRRITLHPALRAVSMRLRQPDSAFRVATPRSRRARSSDPEGSRMARRSPHAAGCPA